MSNRIFSNPTMLQNQAMNQYNSNLVTIEVRNWEGGSKDDLVSFVSRKTRIPLQHAEIDSVTGAIVGKVKKNDADSLIGWTGVRFAGKSLKFSKPAEQNYSISDTIELLKRFLQRRYNAHSKLLDLTNIASDQELQLNGAFSSISTKSKMFPALMKLASTENLVVESVNLSENNLQDISGITTLASTFPELKNLALTNNAISRTKCLEIWKNKFKHLREIILLNNPITTEHNYLQTMLSFFPKLIVLDGNIIRDEMKLLQIYQLPVLKKHIFCEDPEIQLISTQFISNFFQCWDNDRSQLIQLYTNESQFSISVDSSVPNDAQASQVSFGYYMPVSRNLSRVSSENLRTQRLGKGSEQIYKIFQNLPKTKHKITENPNLYSMEAWRYPQVNGFTISFHGEFDETSKPELETFVSSAGNGVRGHRRSVNTPVSSNKLSPKSFDRTFIIVPNGNGLIIASDLLIVRPIASSKTSWVEEEPQVPVVNSSVPVQQVQELPSQPSLQPPIQPPIQPVSGSLPSVSASSMQLSPGVSLSLEQQQFVEKLLIETKLNLKFSLMLAEQFGWNYENAVNGFKQSQINGQIPPEAFQ